MLYKTVGKNKPPKKEL